MLRVLYVDDEPALLEIGKLFLERTHEISAITVSSAKEALEFLKKHHIDVIISDYDMPEINGIEFLKMVRGFGDKVPFIIFTGKGREEVVIQALNAGADFYIQKGGEPKSQFADLINKVQHAVNHKKAELELQQKNREWDGIFQGIAQSALVLTPDQTIIAANKATCDLLELPENEVIGKQCFTIFHQENCSTPHCPGKRLLTTKKHEVTEIVSKPLDKVFLISCTPVLNEAGEVERIIHLAADITEHKNAEEEKACLHRFQDKMLETAAVWIDTLDLNGAVTFWNHAAETISGYSREEVLGKSMIWELLYPDDHYREEIFSKSRAVFSMGENLESFETRIRSKSGEHKIISWSSNTITGEDQSVIGSIAIGIDVTARKRAEEDLSFKNDEIQVANEELLAADDELRKHCLLLQEQKEILQRNEDRLSLALEGSGDGLWDWDVVSGKAYFSPRYYTMLGYEPHAFPQDYENWHSRIHPDDVSAVDTALEDHFRQQTDQFRIEFRMKEADGRWRWILTKGKVVTRDDQGRILRMVGLHCDMAALREKNEEINQYADIFWNMQTGLYIYRLNDPSDDASLQLIRANPASTSELGLNPDTIIGRYIDDIFPNLRNQGIPRIFADVVRTGNVRELPDVEYADDRLRSASYSVKAVPIPGNCVAVLFDNITARKKEEQELSESEEKYRVLIENSNEMIFVIQNKRICYGNQRLLDFLEEYTGQKTLISLYDLVLPEDRDMVERYYYQQTRKDVIPGRCEFRVRMDHGIIRWIEINAVSFTWEGKPAILFFASDVTDHILDRHALEQANKKLNLLTSITRHDILNQLTALSGFLELAEEGDGDLKRNLCRIRAASEIIKTQIEYTRMYNELGAIRPGWFFLGDIINGQAPAFESSGIRIESSPEDLWIYADPMIGKVFYNLIDNAVRYGEKITSIRFSWKESDDNLVIICDDDGVGVTQDMKKKIFQRGVGKNTGFGLFLAYEILSITGMKIQETGEEGKGARFEITVPAGGYKVLGS